MVCLNISNVVGSTRLELVSLNMFNVVESTRLELVSLNIFNVAGSARLELKRRYIFMGKFTTGLFNSASSMFENTELPKETMLALGAGATAGYYYNEAKIKERMLQREQERGRSGSTKRY